MSKKQQIINKSLVSIVVPIYNTCSYLETCLNSIQNQSHKELQVILVNDGSTDDSEIICLKFCANDPRFVYVKKDNGGLSSARNTGLEQAKGEYLGFVDSDDFISRDFVESLLWACIEFQSKVACCGRWVVFDSIHKPMFHHSDVQIWEEDALIERLLLWNGLDGSVWDKLFHRDLLPLLRFSLGRISEDLPITAAILIKAKRLVHIGAPLYYYVQRGNSITNHGFSAAKISVLESTTEVRRMVSQAYPALRASAAAYHWRHVLLLRDMLIGEETVHPLSIQRLNQEIKKEIRPFLSSPLITVKQKLKVMILVYMPFLYVVKKRMRFSSSNASMSLRQP